MKKQKLRQAYRKFDHAEGNQHIASEFAVEKLMELITWFKTKNILEVGLGIGSISGTILELQKDGGQYYAGTEDNPYCLEALNRNLGTNYEKVDIYGGIGEIPDYYKFDLIIIDGKDQNLSQIQSLLSSKGIIVIEGDRMPQQILLDELFPHNIMVHSISLKKNSARSPFPTDEWQGGVKILFINPTLKQKIWWFKEKIFTKLKYQYPGRHFGQTITE
ncbi:hypothetical protein [Salinimicrobium gaetbulicola]|uniref:Methyltransferase family protein n=1 Tax=Salinimicrobium gaetbulicola TaxID=999702 RepID=A0ABW3IJI2_9FLAO